MKWSNLSLRIPTPAMTKDSKTTLTAITVSSPVTKTQMKRKRNHPTMINLQMRRVSMIPPVTQTSKWKRKCKEISKLRSAISRCKRRTRKSWRYSLLANRKVIWMTNQMEMIIRIKLKTWVREREVGSWQRQASTISNRKRTSTIGTKSWKEEWNGTRKREIHWEMTKVIRLSCVQVTSRSWGTGSRPCSPAWRRRKSYRALRQACKNTRKSSLPSSSTSTTS